LSFLSVQFQLSLSSLSPLELVQQLSRLLSFPHQYDQLSIDRQLGLTALDTGMVTGRYSVRAGVGINPEKYAPHAPGPKTDNLVGWEYSMRGQG
jgi:hypothetical protein